MASSSSAAIVSTRARWPVMSMVRKRYTPRLSFAGPACRIGEVGWRPDRCRHLPNRLPQSSTSCDLLGLPLSLAFVSASLSRGIRLDHFRLAFKIGRHLVQQSRSAWAVDLPLQLSIAAGFGSQGTGGKRHFDQTSRRKNGSSGAANSRLGKFGPSRSQKGSERTSWGKRRRPAKTPASTVARNP